MDIKKKINISILIFLVISFFQLLIVALIGVDGGKIDAKAHSVFMLIWNLSILALSIFSILNNFKNFNKELKDNNGAIFGIIYTIFGIAVYSLQIDMINNQLQFLTDKGAAKAIIVLPFVQWVFLVPYAAFLGYEIKD